LRVRVENLSESSLDDRISVCGEDQPDSPSIRRGMEEKKRWLRRMLREHGPPSKLAYVDSKPVGHVQFYPESSVPYLENPDPRTLHVMCSFVRLAQQHNGCGTALFNSLLEEVKTEGRFDRIETLGFDAPGCGFSQTMFWKKMGFKERPNGRPNDLEYAVNGKPTAPRHSQPRSVEERGAKIFYAPTCIYGHQFIDKMEEAIRSVSPEIPVERINMWENPDEAKARGITSACVYINGQPMKHSVFEPENFKKEIQTLISAK
jgi:GNAT superfamily N-acetyltransferase